MTSPNVDQPTTGNHDRPGLHSDSLIPRHDRLVVALSPDPAIPRRARALLAAGVLALSAGGAGTSVASEADRQHEGVVVPDRAPQSWPDHSSDHPGDDLGDHAGSETVLPIEIVLPEGAQGGGPPAADQEDTAPLESEPVQDPEGQRVVTEPPAPTAPAVEVASPPDPASPVVPPVAGTPAPVAIPQIEWPASAPVDERHTPREPSNDDRRAAGRSGPRGEGAPAPPGAPAAPVSAAPPAAPDPPAPPVAPAPPAPIAAGPDASDPPPGAGRIRVVRPGESLWSIAAALLGPGASTTAIAREVQRLWALNAARIGTGDPNLVGVGVRLRLR